MKVILGITTGAFLMNCYIYHGFWNTLAVLTFGLIIGALTFPEKNAQKKTSDCRR